MEFLNELEKQLLRQVDKRFPLIIDYDKYTIEYKQIHSDVCVGFKCTISETRTPEVYLCNWMIFLKNEILENGIKPSLEVYEENVSIHNLKDFTNNIVIHVNNIIDSYHENLINNRKSSLEIIYRGRF